MDKTLKALHSHAIQQFQALASMATAVLLALLFALLPVIHFLTKDRKQSKRLPPGSFGIPILGQSLGLLRAMRTNTGERWIANRIKKYGPISKLSLFGKPAVFLSGQAANKFIFSSDALALQQPQSITRIIGGRNMMELLGNDHKRVRGAVGQFLKPVVLRRYVGKIDEEIRHHLKTNWIGQQQVKVLPTMKSLTFNVICSTMFGIERGDVREKLVQQFNKMINGMWSVPIDLPFTHFHNSLKASRKVRKMLAEVMEERKIALQRSQRSPHEDLITYLLSLGTENGEEALTDEEIIDNAVLVMIAGYDTSSVVITFTVRHLANDPATYAAVLSEQEEIAKSKAPGDALTTDDVHKMKYTWRVAQEILRTIPPIFGSFRRALKDIEFGGYLIPKGWQVFWTTNTTHMDENIFKDPGNFNPDRFENPSIPPYCFIPFGAGARICPGNDFAKTETLVALHYIVTRFKWKLCCKDNTYVRDPMPSPKQGLPVQIEYKASF